MYARRAPVDLHNRASLRAIAAWLLTTGLILVVRLVLDPPGPWLLAILAILVVATPVSTSLSRRILINGSILLGWLPILWWIPAPAVFDRTAWFVAIAAGAVAAYLTRSASLAGSWKITLPRIKPTDAIPLAATALAIWVAKPFLAARDDVAALSLLMKSGWDHVAHFHMAKLLSEQGSVYGTIGSTVDGSDWIGTIYPKHFHALVSSIVGISDSSQAIDGSVSPETYSFGVAAVVIAAVATLAAGVAQLPSLRRSAWAAWPLAGLVVSAFLFGAGASAFSSGFPNFIVGCASAALASFIVLGMTKAAQPLQAFALAGLVVATAHSWLLLLPLAAATVFAIVWPIRLRWSSTRIRMWTTYACIAAACIGVLTAVTIVIPELSGSTATTGGSEPFAAGTVTAVLFSAIGVAVLALLRRPPRTVSLALRSAMLGLVPAVGLAMLVGLGWIQLQQAGTLSYYFSKLATGALLIALISLVIEIAALMRRPRRDLRGWPGRILTTFAGVALAIASMQFFGYVGPGFGTTVPEQSAGLTYRAAALSVIASPQSPEAENMISAANVAQQQDFGSTLYIATQPGDPLARLANQWHLALAGTWSYRAESYGALVDSTEFGDQLAAGELGDAVSDILEENPDLSVIVAPATYDLVRQSVPADYQQRLLSW